MTVKYSKSFSPLKQNIVFLLLSANLIRYKIKFHEQGTATHPGHLLTTDLGIDTFEARNEIQWFSMKFDEI